MNRETPAKHTARRDYHQGALESTEPVFPQEWLKDRASEVWRLIGRHFLRGIGHLEWSRAERPSPCSPRPLVPFEPAPAR
jgi:hypothetical protein